MSEFIEILREPNPACKLPDDLDTPVWRYMDMAKFQSLLKKQALYLCRADCFSQDRFEGTYSRHQISVMEDWLKEICEAHMIDSERKRREHDRHKSYISCWCKYKYDLDLMWKTYIRNPPGIAIRSSVRRLQQACDDGELQPLDISEVNYFDHTGGERIDYFGSPTVFFHKDHHFQLDQEVRIVHYPNISEPTPDHIFLPVSLSGLIELVVLQPNTNEDDLKSVREFLDNAGLANMPVVASRNDRELIK